VIMSRKAVKTSLSTDTKQRIINASILLFSKQGYKATTMRQIAKKVNSTAGSLYNHIEAKEELLLEIQMKFMDELLAKIKECQPVDSAKNKFRNAVEVLMETVAENRLAWQILVDQYHHFPAAERKKIRLKGDELDHLIRAIVEEGERKGEFKNIDSKFTSFFLLGACHHAAKRINPKGKVTPKEIGRQLSSYLLRGLCKSNTFEFIVN
jgi:AcrR family transcriptional regulator